MLLGNYMLPLTTDQFTTIYEYGPKDVTPVPKDPCVYLNLWLTGAKPFLAATPQAQVTVQLTRILQY